MGARAFSGEGVEGALTAFGETKTVAAWADDPRAKAWPDEIRRRLALGWTPEAAIARSLPTPRKVKGRRGREARGVVAWGEAKTVRDWALDPRAGADYSAILGRLAAGWDAERAIATPPRPSREGGITAFGETKAAHEWAKDPRCRVTYTCINVRLQKGMSPEEAITKGNMMAERLAEAQTGVPEDAPEGLPGHTRFLRAWGEVKSTNGWRLDARCRVSTTMFLKRIEEGWDVEEAISTPSKTTLRGGLEAFGETKLLKEWVKDARCKVSMPTFARRLRRGWEAEAAIATPNGYEEPSVGERAGAGSKFPLAVMVTAWGETKCVTDWARDARCSVTPNSLRTRLATGMSPEAAILTPDRTTDLMATAWGETKCVSEWARDPRCVVAETCFRQRVKGGWNAEKALTTPTNFGLISAFGERRTGAEWATDPRCAVSYGVLLRRIAEGMSPEAALTTPPKVAPTLLTAWGETKRLAEWAEDPRCVVDRTCLVQRIARGVTPVAAMTKPSRETTRTARPSGDGRREGTTAFGEMKGLGGWAKDARCKVPQVVLEARLKAGWHPEDALTVAIGVAFDPQARAA